MGISTATTERDRTQVKQAPEFLAGALFTRTQSRVLGLLSGQPGRSFYVTELIELAGVGRGGDASHATVWPDPFGVLLRSRFRLDPPANRRYR